MDISFTQNIVAFIDVLGFKNLVDNSEFTRLQQYFDYVTEDLQTYFEGKKVDYLIISDSIVIYTPYDENNFLSLIQTICLVQARLLCLKILLRGGISFGPLYVQKNKNIVVGQALINAYLLEQKANYPRVIFDRGFFNDEKIKKKITFQRNKMWSNFSEYDSPQSGYVYCNYLYILARFKQFHQNNRLAITPNFIKENIFSNHHYEKYNWLLKNLILALKEMIEAHEKMIRKTIDPRKEKKKLRINKEVLLQLENI